MREEKRKDPSLVREMSCTLLSSHNPPPNSSLPFLLVFSRKNVLSHTYTQHSGEERSNCSMAASESRPTGSWALQTSITVPWTAPEAALGGERALEAREEEKESPQVVPTSESVVHILIQGFADYIWVVLKEAAAKTHGVVAVGEVAGVGALTAAFEEDDFGSSDSESDANPAHDAAPSPPPSSSHSSKLLQASAKKLVGGPPVEISVLLGSRDEALTNIITNSVTSMLGATGDARQVMMCVALHDLGRRLSSPAAKHSAVSAILDAVAALISKGSIV